MSEIAFPGMPHKLDPGPITISELRGQLYPDCKRVRVTVNTSGEGHRPSLDFIIKDASGVELAHSVIVENYDQKTEFTMHILNPDFAHPLTVSCKAYFENAEFSAEETAIVSEE